MSLSEQHISKSSSDPSGQSAGQLAFPLVFDPSQNHYAVIHFDPSAHSHSPEPQPVDVGGASDDSSDSGGSPEESRFSPAPGLLVPVPKSPVSFKAIF